MTCVILFLMNLVPGLSLRVSAEEEEMGLDDGQLGEFAYDYVELKRHVAAAFGEEVVEEEDKDVPSSRGSSKMKPVAAVAPQEGEKQAV